MSLFISIIECPFLCNSTGSINIACDTDTGSCICKDNVIGESCDSCPSSNHVFNSSGCIDTCNCVYGSCDGTNGACECPYNVTGDQCDTCADNHYGISDAGCISCDCNPRGSLSLSCDNVTGHCDCMNPAVGRQCNDCPLTGHYKTEGSEQPLCLACFCFNQSQTCQPDSSNYAQRNVQSNFTELCILQVDCTDSWTSNEASLTNFSSGVNGLQYLMINPVNPMFIAPDKYHGDYHLSYRLNIIINIQLLSLSFQRIDSFIW